MEHAYAGPQLPTHINVLRDLDISLCERPQESGLGSQEMGDERSVSCAALLSTPGSERDSPFRIRSLRASRTFDPN